MLTGRQPASTRRAGNQARHVCTAAAIASSGLGLEGPRIGVSLVPIL